MFPDHFPLLPHRHGLFVVVCPKEKDAISCKEQLELIQFHLGGPHQGILLPAWRDSKVGKRYWDGNVNVAGSQCHDRQMVILVIGTMTDFAHEVATSHPPTVSGCRPLKHFVYRLDPETKKIEGVNWNDARFKERYEFVDGLIIDVEAFDLRNGR